MARVGAFTRPGPLPTLNVGGDNPSRRIDETGGERDEGQEGPLTEQL